MADPGDSARTFNVSEESDARDDARWDDEGEGEGVDMCVLEPSASVLRSSSLESGVRVR